MQNKTLNPNVDAEFFNCLEREKKNHEWDKNCLIVNSNANERRTEMDLIKSHWYGWSIKLMELLLPVVRASNGPLRIDHTLYNCILHLKLIAKWPDSLRRELIENKWATELQ